MQSQRTDELIRDEILSALRSKPGDPGFDFSGVGVAVECGEATLTGSVSDLEAWETAEVVARQVTGVRSVITKLEIHRPMPDAHRDAGLIRAVVDAFGKGHHHH